MNILLYWLIGFLIVGHLCSAWVNTNISVHLWNVMHRKSSHVHTREDLKKSTYGWGGWGDLWTCPICVGTSVFGTLTALGLFLHGASAWLLLVGPLSWSSWACRILGITVSETSLNFEKPKEIKSTDNPALKDAERMIHALQARQAKNPEAGIDPLWRVLSQALTHPPENNPEAQQISKNYLSELKRAEVERCPSCKQGAITRKYMALMHAAGVR